MSERIMMQHGWSSDKEDHLFDATRWFESGMYRRRYVGYLTNETMLRVEIPPFPASQAENLRAWLATALDPTVDPYQGKFGHGLPKVPETYERILMDERFDPRSQIFYVFSYFYEPNKPRDVYFAGFLLEGGRFVVWLERDGVSGEIVNARRYDGLGIGDARHVFYREMEKRQKRMQGKTGAPERPLSFVPPGVKGNMACPQTGWWWTPEPLGRRHFTKGEIVPMLTPDDDTNIWLWSEKQTP